IRLDALEKSPCDPVDDLDVMPALDQVVGDGLEQVSDLQIVIRPDDRPARDAREDLDVAELIELREPGEHADVVERRPEAAPPQGQAELPQPPRLARLRVEVQALFQDVPRPRAVRARARGCFWSRRLEGLLLVA